MVKCNKCQKASPCGCGDTPFTTNYNYASYTCPETCSEYIYTECVLYNGPELTGLNVIPGMNMNQVLQAVYLYQINPGCITTTCHSPFVSVLGKTATSVNIGWASVAEADSYTIRYTTNPTTVPIVWTTLPVVTNSTTSLNVTGLTCGTTYYFVVQANFSTSDCDSLIITAATSTC
jgi:hypothetical protein